MQTYIDKDKQTKKELAIHLLLDYFRAKSLPFVDYKNNYNEITNLFVESQNQALLWALSYLLAFKKDTYIKLVTLISDWDMVSTEIPIESGFVKIVASKNIESYNRRNA